MSTADILAIFLGAGLPTAAAYLLKQGRHTLGDLVGAIAAFYAIVGLGVFLLVWSGRDLIGAFAYRHMGLVVDPIWLWLLVGLFTGVLFSSLLGPLLIVGDRLWLFAGWSVASQVLGLVLTWFLVVVQRLGISGALVANLGAQAVAIGALVYWLRGASSEGRLHFRAPVLLRALRIGIQQCLVSSFAALFKKGDSFILAALLDVRSVGYYSVASSLYDLVLDVPRALVWPMVREVTERDTGDREQRIARSIRVQIPASIILAVACAIVIPPLLPLVYGNLFRGAVVPFIVLTGGVPLRAIHLGISAYFIGTGYPGAMLVPVIVAAISSLGLDLVAVPPLGLLGAAATTVVGELLLAILSVRAFARSTHGLSLSSLVPRRLEIHELLGLPIRLLKSLPAMAEDALGHWTRWGKR
jgi:O-antigen/teichoic acid export membrane protein